MSRALYLYGKRDVRVAPFNLREGKPGEVLLEVAAVGLCGSDLHYYKDGGIGAATIRQPFVPGHEFGGWLANDLPGKRDRKSTRLNSSHANISYAVFCLKKKTF